MTSANLVPIAWHIITTSVHFLSIANPYTPEVAELRAGLGEPEAHVTPPEAPRLHHVHFLAGHRDTHRLHNGPRGAPHARPPQGSPDQVY